MLNKLKFLLAGVGANESRKNLMVIDCKVKNHILYMMSADGFCIKTVECNTDLKDCHFFIDLDSLKKIIKIAGKDLINIQEYKCTIGNIDINYQVKSDDLTYPELSSLLDQNFDKPMSYMAINPEVMQAAIKFAPPNKCFAFRFSGETGPIKIDFGENNSGYAAYIMPVRIDW